VKIYSELRAALKELPHVEISKKHMDDTIKAADAVYKSVSKKKHTGFGLFLVRQLRYTGPAIWILQGIVLLAVYCIINVVYGGKYVPLSGYITAGQYYQISQAAGIMPVLCCCAILICMSGIPLIRRAMKYRMSELELSTRASMPWLLFACFIIVGASNLAALALVAVFAEKAYSMGASSIAAYMLLPYLIACCGCVFISGKVRRSYAAWACAAFCAVLAAVFYGLLRISPEIYEQAVMGIWALLCVVFAAVLALELYGTVRKSGTMNGVTDN